MIALVWVFLAFFAYGLFVGKLGAAILAVLMAGVCLLGARRLDKIEAEGEYAVAQAQKKPTTVEELELQDCECSRSKF